MHSRLHRRDKGGNTPHPLSFRLKAQGYNVLRLRLKDMGATICRFWDRHLLFPNRLQCGIQVRFWNLSLTVHHTGSTFRHRIRLRRIWLGLWSSWSTICTYIGYDNSTRLAREALLGGRSVLELVREERLLDEAMLAEILRPENMIAPRLAPLVV